MKKIFKTIVAIIALSLLPMPLLNANATDEMIHLTTTYYHTAIQLNGSFTNEVTGETSNYSSNVPEQDGNYTDANLIADIENSKASFTTWANGKNATKTNFISGIVNDYYYDVHDEFGEITSENHDTLCTGVDNCEIGQHYVITILDKHQTYLITATASNKEIPSITVSLDAPVAGETVNVLPWSGGICTDPEGCWEQDITPNVTTNDHISIDGANWIEGTYTEMGEGFDDFFEGTFEPQSYYYAMISISAEEGYTLSDNLDIRIEQPFNDGSITVAPAEVFAVHNHNSTFFIAKTKSVTHYIVEFETNSGSIIPNQTLTGSGATNSATVTKPEDPTKSGFEFIGWFTDEELTNEFDFATSISSNLKLYAKWTEIPAEEQENEEEKTENINSKPSSPNTGSYTTTADSAISTIGLSTSIIMTIGIVIFFIHQRQNLKQ